MLNTKLLLNYVFSENEFKVILHEGKNGVIDTIYTIKPNKKFDKRFRRLKK